MMLCVFHFGGVCGWLCVVVVFFFVFCFGGGGEGYEATGLTGLENIFYYC